VQEDHQRAVPRPVDLDVEPDSVALDAHQARRPSKTRSAIALGTARARTNPPAASSAAKSSRVRARVRGVSET
jgi:hypothetical protein